MAVKRQLLREVSFGCPFAECRKPFLTFHHFNPTWHERHHHEPEGMIALCIEHHSQAEGGAFSKADLLARKRAQWSGDAVKAHFPWAKKEFLVRFGGCYVGASEARATRILNTPSGPSVQLSRNPAGLLSLSFRLHTPKGGVLLMDDNTFTCAPEDIHLLEADSRATRIRVWFEEGMTGLDLTFGRLSLEELDRVLAKDERGSLARMRKHLPPDVEVGPGHTRPYILEHARTRCLDDEDKLSLIDIDQARIWIGDKELLVKDGVTDRFSFRSALGWETAFAIGGGSGAFVLASE